MRPDRGSVSVVVAAVLLPLVAVGMTLVVAVAQLAVARAGAQAAADAVALAAAPVTFHPFGTGGDPGAEAGLMAARHDVTLVRCSCTLDRSWATRVVVVEVRVGVRVLGRFPVDVGAAAAAEFAPVRLIGG